MAVYKYTVKTNCKFCGDEFDSFNLNKVCPACESNMDGYFRQIREYLNEFPGATVEEVCYGLKLPVALIKYFLKEERLSIKSKSNNFFLKCEICDKPIDSGRYCSDCEIAAIRSDMKGTYNEESVRMEKEIVQFHTRKRMGRNMSK